MPLIPSCRLTNKHAADLTWMQLLVAQANALAVLQVFVPLARLLGLYSLKQELEELSFQYSNPQAHKLVRSTLQRIRADQQPTVQQVCLLLVS